MLNSADYAPTTKKDKETITASSTGIDALVSEHLIYCPDGAAEPLTISQVRDKFAAQYGVTVNPWTV